MTPEEHWDMVESLVAEAKARLLYDFCDSEALVMLRAARVHLRLALRDRERILP